MSRFFSSDHRFSTHLITGLIILLVLSLLSAGAPAYWVTRTQLEEQAWSHVADAKKSTRSLFDAEQEQLRNLAILFAERPTLQRILQTQRWAELTPYQQAFQTQSKLDILLLCDNTGLPIGAGELITSCPLVHGVGFTLVNAKPALLVSQSIDLNDAGTPVGTVITGVWLDDDFMQQMATRTGVQQSVFALDGTRLSSSLASAPSHTLGGLEETALAATSQPTQRLLLSNGQHFYATVTPLTVGVEPSSLRLELALPVDDLIAAEQRALAILMLSTAAVILGGVFFAQRYIRKLTRPLDELTQVAERMSKGDYVAPIPAFATPAEVATLSTAFIKSQASMLRTLEEQSQARNWLNNLIQSIVEGVITFDAQGRVTFLSQGAERLTGWHSAEAVGQHINLLFPPLEGQTELFLDRIPRPGSKSQIDVINRYGKAMTLAITGARLAPPTGDGMQVALVLHDVTREEALRHLRAYFLANISHEFKTPLSTLNASLELLLESAEDLSLAEIREVLKPAQMSLLGLQNLIDNLLQSSSIEAGHFVIRKRPTNLNQVITDALQLVQPLLDRRRQPFSVNQPIHFANGNEALEVEADPARLTQVVVNLLVNASKYSPIGEPIDLCLEQTSNRLRAAVADRGPGIPPTERLNLFRRFVRLDAQDDDQYGTGLGLYVVKTTIEAHGGQVGIEDRPGGGSIFWFELPIGE